MKKIIAVILSLIISTSAFAEHTFNASVVSMLGITSHTVDNTTYIGGNFDYGISAEYLYIFINGVAVGGNVMFLYETFNNSTKINDITITTYSEGFGYSISPAVGLSKPYNSTYIQVLFYPIIYENTSYKNHTLTVNDISKKYSEDVNYKSIKTGLLSSLQWGWEHIKLGFGIGTNFILADTYEDKNKFKSVFGVEGVGTGKFTYLF